MINFTIKSAQKHNTRFVDPSAVCGLLFALDCWTACVACFSSAYGAANFYLLRIYVLLLILLCRRDRYCDGSA